VLRRENGGRRKDFWGLVDLVNGLRYQATEKNASGEGAWEAPHSARKNSWEKRVVRRFRLTGSGSAARIGEKEQVRLRKKRGDSDGVQLPLGQPLTERRSKYALTRRKRKSLAEGRRGREGKNNEREICGTLIRPVRGRA